MQKKPVLNYINVFRGLAIIIILTGHTLQIGSEGSLLRKISFEITTGGTALFVFIAGYLFQYLSYKFEYKGYLKKKWQNVILPYLITAIPGILACLLIPKIYLNPFDGLNPILQIGIFITTGRVHNVPAWFIPMIAIFFTLSILLLYLEKKKMLYKILPVLILITIFIPRGDIEPIQVMNLDYLGRYFAYLKYILIGFIHFSSSYVLGMYFSLNNEKIDVLYKYRYFLFMSMLIVSVVDIWSGIMNVTISKLLFTVLLLGLLKHYDEKIMKMPELNKFMNVTAEYSFGLFFVHWYFVFVFNRLFTLHNGALLALIRFITVFGLSFLTLYLIKTLLLKAGMKNTRKFIGV